MRQLVFASCILGVCFAASLFTAQEPSATPASASWSGKAAATYLDARLEWWMGWPVAKRDHETFCVSCHTVLPYALARPALRAALAEQAPSSEERKLLDNVTKRVRLWKEVEPFYPDAKRGAPKTAESRGTESVLNALILVGHDAPAGRLSPDARLALDNMWAEQLKTGDARGAWMWLEFGNSPWEGNSQYYGATLAALAAGAAPGHYQSAPEIQQNMKLLREYLSRNRDAQTLLDRLMLLWASTKMSGLLATAQQQSIIEEALSKQRDDGGFSLSSFVGTWKRKDGTPLETRSDGYATGVVAFVLQQAGMKRDDPRLSRTLAWLMLNQEKADGRWLAYSLNKQRDLSTDIGRFMSDAATGYAVLALKGAN
ncbi:MAG: hypothetical protein LAP13_10280 [Acidobacteriia bacterium]|nr:hypothetical protein [Terriglobia bacterium]